MDSGDKTVAIFATATFLGLAGSLIVGWPAVVCAAIAIIAIARSPTPPDPDHA